MSTVRIGRSIRIPKQALLDLLTPPIHRQPAAMNSRGNLQRNCVKGHPKTAGRCSGRCIRWYPRLELPRGPGGRRRFEALGGYPTRSQAEAALADALTRRSRGVTSIQPSSPSTSTWTAGWPTSRPACTPEPSPATLHCSATTSDPTSAPGRSSSCRRWRCRPSTIGSPSAGAGTASPAGWPPGTSWPCTAACTAPWPRPSPGGCSPATSPPMPPHRRSPAPR
jgi:hypothetical protein